MPSACSPTANPRRHRDSYVSSTRIVSPFGAGSAIVRPRACSRRSRRVAQPPPGYDPARRRRARTAPPHVPALRGRPHGRPSAPAGAPRRSPRPRGCARRRPGRDCAMQPHVRPTLAPASVGFVVGFVGFGRRAHTSAALSASTARYAERPPLRATSRETVETADPTRRRSLDTSAPQPAHARSPRGPARSTTRRRGLPPLVPGHTRPTQS